MALNERALSKPVAYVWLVLVTAIWGSSLLITRHALQLAHPFMFLSLRFMFATLLLALLFPSRLRW